MQDIQTLAELGQTIREMRLAARLSTVEVARDSGRSRDVLHLLAILAAIGRRIELAALTRPTLDDMQRRFAHLQDDTEPPETKRSRGDR
jgi:hypothetical protein